MSFRDFVPRDETRMLALSRAYESLDEVVARANAWMTTEGITPIHVETLLLPRPPRESNGTATAVEINAGSVSFSQWHQVVRIWFHGEVS